MPRTKLVLSLLAALAIALAAGQSRAATFTDLLDFNATNGAYPAGDVTISGNTLYGMTAIGGANVVHYAWGISGPGNVFSLPLTGGVPTDVADFNYTDGGNPYGSLTLSGGTLYATTSQGGATGQGNIVSIPLSGGTPVDLGDFNGTNGNYPNGSLTLSGNTLYGMASGGGANGYGTIFSVPVTGGTPTDLFDFDGAHGANPYGNLTLSGNTLYGMTPNGGANGVGNIFSVPTTGGTPTNLFDFVDATDGPRGSLTLSGNTLYGMTEFGGANGYGNIFSIPVSGGTPTDLFDFNGTNGQYPVGNLTLSGSKLYGMTADGGANGFGTIFSIPVTGGTLTDLFDFNYSNGAYPQGSLNLSGNTLFGMTYLGGANGYGTVFSLTVAPVPESSSVALFGLGVIALGAGHLRRGKRQRAVEETARASASSTALGLPLLAAALFVACASFGNMAVAATIYSDSLNDGSAPNNSYINNVDSPTTFPNAFDVAYPGWSATGVDVMNSVNTGSGLLPMFFDGYSPSDNTVFTSDAIAAANTLGQWYAVSFDIGPGAYGGGQATAAGDGIVLSVLDSSNSLLGTQDFYPELWSSVTHSIPFERVTLEYRGTGVGSGAAELSFSGIVGGDVQFGGTIQDVALATVPEPSSVVLLGLGALGLYSVARRRRRG